MPEVIQIGSLPAASVVSDTDQIPAQQGSTTRKMSISQIREAIGSQWMLVPTAYYTATPVTTSTIAFSNTSQLKVGMPVRILYSSIFRYAVITAIATNSSITITGAPLNTGVAITSIHFGLPSNVMQVDLFINGVYGDTVSDLLASKMNTYFRWNMPQAALVTFSATHKTADTGTEAKINMKVNGNLVSTDDSSNGIQLGTAGSWVDNSAVGINISNYIVSRGNSLNISCTAAGGSGDAANLTVSCTFVFV